ncbi:MAG TPA: glycosyltransferase family 2 protein [Euzebyales bacterium]|nr:glycosyltransferase family 2 protein [Euzebyales bacterium]
MSGQVALTAVLAVFVIGVNFTIWALIGCLRAFDDHRRNRAQPRPVRGVRREELAVLIAAHNEEPVLRASIDSVTPLLGHHRVYVVSDASTDRTVDVARDAGVSVLRLRRNRGKAGALRAGIERFGLLDRYRAVMFLDADSEADTRYFDEALLLLAEPDVAAVAGYVQVQWEPRRLPFMGRLILSHRNRLYTITQLLQKYGQTWRRSSVCYIVPGFASIYRAEALDRIDIDPRGLVIEDFNMTFEVHRKRLGRIALSPRAVAYSQDPHTLRDYISQVRRWNLGFWQTIRRHGVWFGWFWVAMGLFITELITSSVLLLTVPLIALILALPPLTGELALGWPWFAGVHGAVTGYINGWTLLFGVVLPDYAMTCLIAAGQRRPGMLLLGLASLPFRVLDAYLGLTTAPRAWFTTSNGQWTSPARR